MRASFRTPHLRPPELSEDWALRSSRPGGPKRSPSCAAPACHAERARLLQVSLGGGETHVVQLELRKAQEVPPALCTRNPLDIGARRLHIALAVCGQLGGGLRWGLGCRTRGVAERRADRKIARSRHLTPKARTWRRLLVPPAPVCARNAVLEAASGYGGTGAAPAESKDRRRSHRLPSKIRALGAPRAGTLDTSPAAAGDPRHQPPVDSGLLPGASQAFGASPTAKGRPSGTNAK